jgi:hypothetical protein
MRVAQEQIQRVGGDASVGARNIVKVLDEYNYSVFTKGWLKPPQHKQGRAVSTGQRNEF